MNIDILEWSRATINSIMKINYNSDYLFKIIFVIDPNPLDYDGCDSVIIEIWKINQKTKYEMVWFSTFTHLSLNEAIKEVNDIVKTYEKEIHE